MQETQEMWVQSLGLKDSLEEEMATHSIFLPEKFHGQEESGGLQSVTKRGTRLSSHKEIPCTDCFLIVKDYFI